MSKYEDDWFGPNTGILAGGVPLPPRRPPDLGGGLPGPRTMPSAPRYTLEQRGALQGLIDEFGYAEGQIIPTPGNPTVPYINSQINGPPHRGPEDVAAIPKQPLPSEYEPQRPIPLGEIQRRWGVPRLEDL